MNIKQEIQAKGLTAPRITLEDIEANIASEHYFTAADGCHRVTDEMVSRFLAWQLPADFHPDCGISFDGRKDDEWVKNKTWPTGTNLLYAEQVRKMLEHVLQPHSEQQTLQHLTFCVLILRNGTKITGINYGAIDPAQHSSEKGRVEARNHAIEQIWPLMGYQLRESLHQNR